jgi:hypothetical protein
MQLRLEWLGQLRLELLVQLTLGQTAPHLL